MSRDHISQNTKDVLVYGLLNVFGNVALGVDLARILDSQLFAVLFSLLLDALRPLFAPFAHLLQIIPASFRRFLLVLELEGVVPLVFIEIEQHLLLELVGAVVDIDRVVVLIEALVHRLNRWFVEMAAD